MTFSSAPGKVRFADGASQTTVGIVDTAPGRPIGRDRPRRTCIGGLGLSDGSRQ